MKEQETKKISELTDNELIEKIGRAWVEYLELKQEWFKRHPQPEWLEKGWAGHTE